MRSEELWKKSCYVSTSVRDLCQDIGKSVESRGKDCERENAGAQSPEERSDEGLWAPAARRASPPGNGSNRDVLRGTVNQNA